MGTKEPSEKYQVLLAEKYSSLGKEIYYSQPPNQNVLVAVTSENSFSKNILQSLREFFQEIFLPQGYPQSVSSDYTQYQIWDTAQAFCSTITGTLATHAVMKGVGVGDAEATPLAATITWVLKEGTGNLGRIAFAWWKGTSLDANSKKWRLAADCLNDAAICLELVVPLFKDHTTYVLCLSTAMKSIVGVTGGATRAALTQHQAIRGNLADVSAKDGSQETAVNLIASFVAVFIISLVGQNIWPVFFLFTICHLIFNYCAVSAVCLNTFNSTRFLHAMLIFLQHQLVLKPSDINSLESVFFSTNEITDRTLCGFNIKVGSSIKNMVSSKRVTLDDMKDAIESFQGSRYMIIFDMHNKCIHIVLEEMAESEDILLAYFHAFFFGIVISGITKDNFTIFNDKESNMVDQSSNMCFQSYHYLVEEYKNCGNTLTIQIYNDINEAVMKMWKLFHKTSINLGWNFDKNLIISDEWRGHWRK